MTYSLVYTLHLLYTLVLTFLILYIQKSLLSRIQSHIPALCQYHAIIWVDGYTQE